jgi:methionyl-tRNA formyltransferase
VLEALRREFEEVPFLVTTFREPHVTESFDVKIAALANASGFPVYPWDEIRRRGEQWIRAHDVRAVICVGWRYMVPRTIISALNGCVIVAHDSLLPRYRGFAPLASALINGEREVGVTVLLASDELDAGDVLFQGRVPVGAADTIADLIERVAPLYVEGVEHAVRCVLGGNLQPTPQDHARASYSLWRDNEDLFIDWYDGADRIARTIRALGPPYLGARTRLGDRVVVLQRAVEEPDLFFEIRQPGKVWRLTAAGEPVVVCGRGLLVILQATIGEAPLIPMKRLRVRFR